MYYGCSKCIPKHRSAYSPCTLLIQQLRVGIIRKLRAVCGESCYYLDGNHTIDLVSSTYVPPLYQNTCMLGTGSLTGMLSKSHWRRRLCMPFVHDLIHINMEKSLWHQASKAPIIKGPGARSHFLPSVLLAFECFDTNKHYLLFSFLRNTKYLIECFKKKREKLI